MANERLKQNSLGKPCALGFVLFGSERRAFSKAFIVIVSARGDRISGGSILR